MCIQCETFLFFSSVRYLSVILIGFILFYLKYLMGIFITATVFNFQITSRSCKLVLVAEGLEAAGSSLIRNVPDSYTYYFCSQWKLD